LNFQAFSPCLGSEFPTLLLKFHCKASLLQKDGLDIPEVVIGNQAFEKSKSSGFPLSRE
jgi:hypothetical protein